MRASPSVCPCGMWNARISSPLKWMETASSKVTTGRATSGDPPATSLVRTFVCATMVEASPNSTFPPV